MAEFADIVPISDLRIRQGVVLEKMRQGPVVLSQRGRASAVIVSWERWKRLTEELELLQDSAEATEIGERLASGETDLVSLADVLASHGETERVPA